MAGMSPTMTSDVLDTTSSLWNNKSTSASPVMAYVELIWDLDDDPHGNVQHIAQHGLTKDDVVHALANAWHDDHSRSSGSPIGLGPALDGRDIAVDYDEIDDMQIYPITAYEI